MSDTKPPRTKFPKQYVIDRIDARIASLKSKDDGADEKVAAHEATKARNAEAWVRNVSVAFKRADAEAEKALGAVDFAKQDAAPDANVQAAAHRLYDAVDIPIPPWNARVEYDSVAYKEAEAARTAVLERKNRAREIGSLEHAKAYLEGTPVDEFSLHGLEKLKLLDVVSFNVLVDVTELPAHQRYRRR